MPMRLPWFQVVSRSKMYYLKLFLTTFWAALLAVTVSACGGGGGGGGGTSSPVMTSPTSPTPAASNVLAVTVGAGPVNTGYNVNRLYTSVTVCYPGSSTRCQKIDHVLVDTGSTGLRIFSSMVAALGLNLQTGSGGRTLLNCAQFVDNTYSWGPVATADVLVGGKTAASLPIQLIADPAFEQASGNCSSGANMTTPIDMGANGIIGMGFLKEDCGPWCVTHSDNGFYYTCANAACLAVAGNMTSIAKQVKHPVPLFSTDNNGFVIDLPAVDRAGAISVNGSLIFGVGTQTNNRFNAGTLLVPDAKGNFRTVIGARGWSASFIDTGSNGLYFDYDGSLAKCTGDASHFYCPANPLSLPASLTGLNAASLAATVLVDHATSMFAAPQKSVLPALAGPIGNANSFDWGLPFYYGRRVFMTIEGQTSAIGTGPVYAF